MMKKTIIFIILFKQIGFSLASINIEGTTATESYVSKSFQRPNDTSDDAGTLRLNEINSLCEALEDFIPDDSLNLFLGRSVGWIAAAESFRLESDYSNHKGAWKAVHFSGGSASKGFEDEGFYTSGQLNSYKDYLCSIGVTPENILGAEDGIYLIDFILMGRTMHHFSKILIDWCHEERPHAPPPKINFIDISFTTNYRSTFEHETVLSPPPTQFLLSNETMNPLIHAEGEDDIGKDNSLVCSFKPEQWATWKSTLENYQPTPKALEMHEDLKAYLSWAKYNNFKALTEKNEETLLKSKYSLRMFIPQKLKNYFF